MCIFSHTRVCCSVCVAVHCSTLQYIAVRCSHSVFMPGKYLVRRGGQNKNKNKNKNGMASVGDSNVCYMTCKYSISSVCKKINLRSQDTLEIESFVHKAFFGCLTPKETHIYRKFWENRLCQNKGSDTHLKCIFLHTRVYCSACVAVCCSVLNCVALQCVAVCCSVLHCVAVCYCVLQYVAVCCRVLQCVPVCCNVVQSVAVRHPR